MKFQHFNILRSMCTINKVNNLSSHYFFEHNFNISNFDMLMVYTLKPYTNCDEVIPES